MTLPVVYVPPPFPEHHRFSDALSAVESPTKGQPLHRHTVASVGRVFLDHLRDAGAAPDPDEAARVCIRACASDTVLWHEATIRFTANHQGGPAEDEATPDENKKVLKLLGKCIASF